MLKYLTQIQYNVKPVARQISPFLELSFKKLAKLCMWRAMSAGASCCNYKLSISRENITKCESSGESESSSEDSSLEVLLRNVWREQSCGKKVPRINFIIGLSSIHNIACLACSTCCLRGRRLLLCSFC